jgi:two-component system, cell cycle sensor histidine kinase DivJ
MRFIQSIFSSVSKQPLHEGDADKMRMLLTHMTDAIVFHKENGDVRFASDKIESLLSIKAGDLTLETLLLNLLPADRTVYSKSFAECKLTNLPVSHEFKLAGSPDFADMSLEKRMSWLTDAINTEAPVNAVIWVEMVVKPIDEGFVTVWRDITARRLQDARIENIQKETTRVQDMKSRFLANITHELRTPLNAVLGFSQMLMLGGQDDAKKHEYAGLIYEAGDHLLSIVNSILDMSKLDSGRFDTVMSEFALSDVIDQSQQIIGLKAQQAGIKLHRIMQNNLPEITADKRAMRQIMLNLLSNAVKFTPAGGSITTHVRYENDAFVISIADTGIGIADSDMAHLGEAFYQARGAYDRPYEGTGLGLSIVKGLVALHEGSVNFKSRPNEGTIVTVTIPSPIEQEFRKTA